MDYLKDKQGNENYHQSYSCELTQASTTYPYHTTKLLKSCIEIETDTKIKKNAPELISLNGSVTH